MNTTSYTIDNVRLEEGFNYEGDHVVSTVTGLYTLNVQNGTLIKVEKKDTYHLSTPSKNHSPEYIDAKGMLLLPALSDMHIHLDKTFYTEPWQAPRRGKTILEMIDIDADWVRRLLPKSQYRAQALIKLLLHHGTTFARSHCNIDPVSGVEGLFHLQQALATFRSYFNADIVAFPQHGLLLSNSVALMREAAQSGIQFVGGLDPTNVDGALHRSLDTLFQIADDYQLGLDIHLHETGVSGVEALNYLIKTVTDSPRLQGQVTLSHGFALADLDDRSLIDTATRMAEVGISLTTTIPLGKLYMPLPTLIEQGVNVMVGTDSVVDHWSPFGTGDMLEKANLYAQVYRQTDEFRLSRALKIATRGVTPLADDGSQVWPKIGAKLNAILVKASCSAEAVARKPQRQHVFSEGQVLSFLETQTED